MEYEKYMTGEQALRWMLMFGKDWVRTDDLYQTWADSELPYWVSLVHKGYLLERTDEHGLSDALKLTDMALKLIGRLI